MIKRRKTRVVKIGGLRIGGNNPIAIQSMAKTHTTDVAGTVAQIRALERAGCEIVRLAVKSREDTEAVRLIKRRINMPLVCDIHFDYRLALACIAAGADKIRLNPGNIRKTEEIAPVVKAAKAARIPIRIGVNSGSVEGVGRRAKGEGDIGMSSLVSAAMGYIRLFEKMDFHDIIISLKSSGVTQTVEAYEAMSARCNYPLHLGVTAAGPYDRGIIKSSIGIGALLLKGIGDTIRVSLTADPVEEVLAAKRILSALGMRRFGPEIISCPTCGRCQVDLVGIVKDLENKVSNLPAGRQGVKVSGPMTIAVMGCEVNGPGEAKEADIGIAFGKDSGMIFKKGKILKKVSVKNAVNSLLKLL